MKLAAEIRVGTNKITPSNGQNTNPVSGYLYTQSAKMTSRISQECSEDAYLEAFEQLARSLVFRAFDQLQQLRQRGRTPEEAWNESGILLSRVVLTSGWNNQGI